MKFGEILKQVEKGSLKTLTPKVVQDLGKRYLEKYPEKTEFHSNQKIAEKLSNLNEYSVFNDDIKNEKLSKNGIYPTVFLVETLGSLDNTNGWLAEKISSLLNKAMDSNIELVCNISSNSGCLMSRVPRFVVDEFYTVLRKKIKTQDSNETKKDPQKELIMFYRKYKNDGRYELQDFSSLKK
ncbi:hypothetical protein L3V83_10490 [Thiotrichales bacterium 19X7-9]|nr:hypothetical protein [Thiotrichales bacterium 19X7-9]